MTKEESLTWRRWLKVPTSEHMPNDGDFLERVSIDSRWKMFWSLQ